MKTPTQRNYTNILTGESFKMYHSATTGQNDLRNEKTGQVITAFYCAAFNGITLKLKDKRIIYLNSGEFIEITPGTIPTHRKYTGLQKRFTKI